MKIMNYAELNRMSIEELRTLNAKVIEVIKMKKHEVALGVKEGLQVEKINRTKASLKVLNGFGLYTVPLSMIEVI